jgi:hypothetical protein
MPVPSVARTVTEENPLAFGVPEMTPPVLIDRPVGSLLAVNRRVCAEAESLALIRTEAIFLPLVLCRVPGLVTVTVWSVAWNAPVPSGVPHPVGPSNPA